MRESNHCWSRGWRAGQKLPIGHLRNLPWILAHIGHTRWEESCTGMVHDILQQAWHVAASNLPCARAASCLVILSRSCSQMQLSLPASSSAATFAAELQAGPFQHRWCLAYIELSEADNPGQSVSSCYLFSGIRPTCRNCAVKSCN